MSDNPFAAPSADLEFTEQPLGPVLREHPVTFLKGSNELWTLQVHENALRFTPDDSGTEAATVGHSTFAKDATIVLGVGSLTVVNILRPEKRSFKLSPEAVQSVRSWLRPMYLDALRAAFKKRWGFWQAFLLLGFVIFPTFYEASGNEYYFGLAASIVLTGCLVASRVRPHRLLFLSDIVLWVYLIGYTLNGAIKANSWWVFGLFAFSGFAVIMTSVRSYQFYNPEVPPLG